MLTLAGLLFAAPAHAQAPSEELGLSQRSRAIERSTMSPFCPGKTLYDCPSPRAAEWRADIRGWLAEGATAEQIRRRLQAREPEFDLDGARPSGVVMGGLLALVTLIMLAVGVVVWRRSRSPGLDEDDDEPEPPSELDARLEAELARTEPYG